MNSKYPNQFVATMIIAALAAIVPASAQSAQNRSDEEKTITLDAFTVTANAVDGYKATNVLSGTRFNTSLFELPKPVDVVTREFMDDIGALDITEALRYTPSIAVDRDEGNADKTDSNVMIRGFDVGGSTVSSGGGNQYINGYRTYGNFDNISVERLEILKGPSSLFSGAIAPGGAINTIVRRGSDKRKGSFSLNYGSHRSSRVELESAGPLGKGNNLSYWLGLAAHDYGSHRDFYNYKRVVGSASLEWRATKNTLVSLFTQWMDNEQLPAAHEILWNPTTTENIANVPRNFNRNGPEAFNDSQQSHSVMDVVHKLNDNWAIKVGGIYRHIDNERNLVTGSTNIPVDPALGPRTVTRIVSYIFTEEKGHTFQGYFMGKHQYLGLDHQVIAGYEYFFHERHEDARRMTPGPAPINVDNPVYIPGELGNPWDLVQYRRLAGRYRDMNLTTQAFSVNNLWQTLNKRVTAQLGYRYDDTKQWYDDLLNPALSSEGTAKPANLLSGGVTVRVLPRVAVFASHSESYEPLVGSDFFGNPFDPREGKGVDVGVRWDLEDGRFSATVVAFQATNKNLLEGDPDHPGFSVQSGETESKGIELGAFAQPLLGWNVVGSYTYNDARVVADITRPFNVGLRRASVPQHSWSMWNRYQFQTGALKGFGLGAGINYVSERRGHPNFRDLPGLRSPEYYLLQLSASYTTRIFDRRTSFSIHVKNALDEVYRVGYGGFGAPRTVLGKVTTSF